MYFYEDDVAAVVGRARHARRRWRRPSSTSPTAQGLDVERNIAYADDFVARWRGHRASSRRSRRTRPYTVSPELYRRLHALAERLDVPLVTHLAETQDEARSRTVRSLARPPSGEPRSCSMPAWSPPTASGSTARRSTCWRTSRAGVVHNPRSNLKLASGVAPVPDMLRAGVPVGLGTDGAASNNELDLFAEIQLAALLHKGVRLDPLAVPAAAALEMATIGGARALGLDDRIGSLEVGKRADVVIIDLDEDNLVPLYDPVSHLAYAIEAADVRTVIVDGRIVLHDGELLTADEREIRRQVRALATEIGHRQRADG